MIRNALSFILIAVLFLSACQKADTFTEDEKEIIRSSVKQTLDDYYDAIRTGGMMAEFGYLDNSPEFFGYLPDILLGFHMIP